MIYVQLLGSERGSRWREHGVITYLDMTRFQCYINAPYPTSFWSRFCKPIKPDWVLFVITPRDTGVLKLLPYTNRTIFVAHNFDFTMEHIPDNPRTNDLSFFTPKQKDILDAVGKRVRKAGGKYFPDIKTAVGFLKTLVED